MTFSYSYIGNVLYITPTGELPQNTQYSFHIEAGLSGIVLPSGEVGILTSDYDFWFTSQYCPLFTTINKVKMTGGIVLDSVLDDAIYRLIHKNSMDAIDLLNLDYSTAFSYTVYGCDWTRVPTYLRRYVECKTAYDLLSILRTSQLMGTGGGGGQTKTLGDMTIIYGGLAGGGAIDPKQLKDLYDCWKEALRMFGGAGGMDVTVKAYYDTSLGYSHPARNQYINRVIRPVGLRGHFTPGTPWVRGF